MAVMQGVKEVQSVLRVKAHIARQEAAQAVVVGYTANYAFAVHERVDMKWRGQERRSGVGVYWGPTGQAKFLEAPARQYARELGSIVRMAVQRGKTMLQGLMLAGLRLQRESQLRVPVEFGFLRGSAFTRVE